MGSGSWVVGVIAALLILAVLMMYVLPLLNAGRSEEAPPSSRRPATTSSSASLARGFSYLHVSPRSSTRRAGVHERFARAFQRIDAVDPHAAPRRIGEALLHAGLADVAAPQPPTTAPDQPWTPTPAEQPRDVWND